MIAINEIKKFNFEDVQIDPFWNTGSQKELKIHRIHAYPAKFPAFITTKAIDYANTTLNLHPKRIADIFCGCGTTAFESRRNKLNFWGCDINPVATLIAKTKSRKYQSGRLKSYFEKIIKIYYELETANYYKNAQERLIYWYFQKQYNDLFKLRESILITIPEKSEYRLFFLCAFSNILKATSKWLTKSIKPQVDPNKIPADVIETFQEQFKLMFIANKEIEELSNVESEIITGNFLDESWEIPKIDMIITSPPYVTSYEYADLHQLSSLWLDFVEDYRDLREGTIGSLYNEYNFGKELKRLNSTGYSIVSLLLDQHKSKSRSVAKYFLDMQKVAQKAYKILNNNGLALFVIGNTEYKNVRIDNAKHLAESLDDAGFKDITVTKRKISKKILTPYRDEKGKFTTNSTGRKVYSEEFILIGRKK